MPSAFVGAFSTLLHVVLFVAFREWWSPLLANLVALIAATVVNTELNHRSAFRSALRSRLSAQVRGLVTFGIC